MATKTPPEYTHDPDAILRYGVDWGTNGWLGTDTIATSTWTVTPRTAGDVSMTLSSSTHDTTTTAVKVTGGTASHDYTITNHIVTAAGYADDRSIKLKCRQR